MKTNEQTVLTNTEMVDIAKQTESADPGRDGYVLPISFGRAIEQAVLARLPAASDSDPWHTAVLNECMRIEGAYIEADPAKTVASLIDWHVKNGREAGAAPVAVLRYERGTPGRENEMPCVVSCNRLPDGEYQVYLAAPSDAPAQQDSERNWHEDAQNYMCNCHACGKTFIGYKRRVTCKLCAPAAQGDELYATLHEIAHRDSAASVTVRAADLRALLAYYALSRQPSAPASAQTVYVPIAVNSHDEAGGRHPNDKEPSSEACRAALNRRGDDKGQGLDPYWKWGFRSGWNAALAAAKPEGSQPSAEDANLPIKPDTETIIAMMGWREMDLGDVGHDSESASARMMQAIYLTLRRHLAARAQRAAAQEGE